MRVRLEISKVAQRDVQHEVQQAPFHENRAKRTDVRTLMIHSQRSGLIVWRQQQFFSHPGREYYTTNNYLGTKGMHMVSSSHKPSLLLNYTLRTPSPIPLQVEQSFGISITTLESGCRHQSTAQRPDHVFPQSRPNHLSDKTQPHYCLRCCSEAQTHSSGCLVGLDHP